MGTKRRFLSIAVAFLLLVACAGDVVYAAGTGIGETYTTYKERTTNPDTPASTYDRLFFKADGLHYINAAGADVLISGAGNLTSATDPATNAAATAAIVSTYAGTIITTTGAGNSQTLGTPTDATVNRIFMVINNDTSTNSIPVVANSVTFTVTPGESQSFVWDGTAWGPTDLGITAIPVVVAQGGTGLATLTSNAIYKGNGTGNIAASGLSDDGTTITAAEDVSIGSTTAGKNLTINATRGNELSPAYSGASGVNWTLGAGWETPIAGGVLNKSGDGTGTATPTAASAVVAGTTYIVTITPTITVGSFSYTLGGVTGTSITGSAAITDYITASTTGNVIITPTNTSRGTVTVSWKALTNATGDFTVDGDAIFHGAVSINGTGLTTRSISSISGSWNLTSSYPQIGSTTPLIWSTDLYLNRDAADTLSLRRSTNQQKLNIYNTAASATADYERLAITGVQGASVNLTAETNGTGGDNLNIVLTPAGTGNTQFVTGNVMVGDTANAKSTQGLTINQGANDDEIISLKSSDVSHAFSGVTEADTFGYIAKSSSTGGGIEIRGLTDSDAIAASLIGMIYSTDPTDTTAAVMIRGNKSDGGTGSAAMAATETVAKVTNYTTDLFAILGNGNLQIGGIVTPGTSLAGGAVWKSGTAATTAPADAAQIWVADYLGTAGDARLHVMGEGSAAAKTALGSGKVSITGTTGGYTRKLAEATANIEADASTTIEVNVPAVSRIIGVQLRVDSALAAGELWDVAFSGGSTDSIATGQAVAKSTKVNSLASAVVTSETDIAITKNGGGSFSAQGTIRAIVYYETLDTMADAP